MEVEELGQHISRSFNEELEQIRNSVLQMGGLVEEQFDRALRALTDADSELGLQVAQDDVKINQMELAIDEECSRVLATRAPAAGDLRLIIATIKTITDLERIGDEAEKIGHKIDLINLFDEEEQLPFYRTDINIFIFNCIRPYYNAKSF